MGTNATYSELIKEHGLDIAVTRSIDDSLGRGLQYGKTKTKVTDISRPMLA